MLTHDEIAKIVTKGTTTLPNKVKVLWVDERFALVKKSGGNIYNRVGRTYVKPWIDLYLIDELVEAISENYRPNGKKLHLDEIRITDKKLPEILAKAEEVYLQLIEPEEEEEEEEEKETVLDWDMDKLEELYRLTDIPSNCGEQFIDVKLTLSKKLSYGEISFGFDWKMYMGTIEFSNLDEAIKSVKKLIEQYKPSPQRK
jgi:hypothetical protein